MICPECGEECEIQARDNSFNHPGGIYRPIDDGVPESQCCEAEITEPVPVDEYDPFN